MIRLKCMLIRDKDPTPDRRKSFDRPSLIFEFFKSMSDEPEEVFRVVFLDARHRYMGDAEVSRGSLNSSIVHPREVFKRALGANAGAIILLHNHPSGDPSPSEEDVEITRRIVHGGYLLGITVVDHIVIGGGNFCSLAELGRMPCS